MYNASMPRVLSTPKRPTPSQERSAKRVEGILNAADALFAEIGYDDATMSKIAQRSGSSIGGLYRYYPDKQSVALALLYRYAAGAERHWAPLITESSELSVRDFAYRLVDEMSAYVLARPVYMMLLGAPVRFARDAASRQWLRSQFVAAFRVRNPRLDKNRALMVANVTVQIVRGLVLQYVEGDPSTRKSAKAEFGRVLGNYLQDVLGSRTGDSPTHCSNTRQARPSNAIQATATSEKSRSRR